jgi:hypothetical protein
MRAIQRLIITVIKKILLKLYNCDLKVVKPLTDTDTLTIYLRKVLEYFEKYGEGSERYMCKRYFLLL